MSIFTWLKSWFSKTSKGDALILAINQLVPAAIEAVKKVDEVKEKYKNAEGIDAKNQVIVSYIAELEGEQKADKIASDLAYYQGAALWTELAVLGLKFFYPNATGYLMRIAVPLAFAIFINRESEAAK